MTSISFLIEKVLSKDYVLDPQMEQALELTQCNQSRPSFRMVWSLEIKGRLKLGCIDQAEFAHFGILAENLEIYLGYVFGNGTLDEGINHRLKNAKGKVEDKPFKIPSDCPFQGRKSPMDPE